MPFFGVKPIPFQPPRDSRPVRKKSSRFGLLRTLLASLLVVVVITTGVVGTLWAAGIPPQKLAFWRASEAEVDSISLPMNWQVIPAYSKVSRGDLLNPTTGKIAGVKVPLASLTGMSASMMSADGTTVDRRVSKVDRSDDGFVFQLDDGSMVTLRQITKLGGAFIHATDIIGRVVKNDKSPGFAFSEGNFFSEGTPAGLAGATPRGMRAMTLQAAQLAGVHRISQGEQIDLVANIPLQKLERFEYSTGSRLLGSELINDGQRTQKDGEKETTARLVANGAIVLMPVVQRVSTESSASLTQGKRLLRVPVEEVVLAVAAEDVAAVTAALELGATVNVLVRSGRPETESPAPTIPAGMVAVPIPGQSLLAYQTIQTASFQDPATAAIRTIIVPVETASASSWVTDLSQLVGRVPRQDLAPTIPVRESDLMPAGTPAGLSGSTPPGRVLFFLDAEHLVGGDAFEFGQHLDLIASRTTEAQKGRSGFVNVTLTEAQRTRVEPIADDVIVMMPIQSLGNPTRRKIDREERWEGKLIVAVWPEQVAALEYAVAIESNLRATVRATSGTDSQPTRDPAQRQVTVMRFDPLADSKRTDIYVGGSRESQLFQVPQ